MAHLFDDASDQKRRLALMHVRSADGRPTCSAGAKIAEQNCTVYDKDDFGPGWVTEFAKWDSRAGCICHAFVVERKGNAPFVHFRGSR